MEGANSVNETDVGKTRQQIIAERDDARKTRDLTESVLDLAADAIISIDENHCITRFNWGAEQIFGYRAREMIGNPLEILLPEQFRRGHDKHVKDYGSRPNPSRLMNERTVIAGRKKDGSTFPARASISRITQDDKVVLTVFLRDISDIRRSEREAQQAQEELERVNRIGLLGEISASLAHELNQPLTAILTNAQVVKRELEASPRDLKEMLEIVTDVISDTLRAAEVIKRLRTLISPQEREPELVDLNPLIVQAKSFLESELILRQAFLTLELAPGLPAVSVDSVQLQQVLLNLLGNAIDALDAADSVDRHLLIRSRQVDSTSLEVCVKDSGPGFQEGQLEQIFEPFYTTKKGGMGMGLAISKTMLQACGGRFWAENNRGPGATFHFTLPVADRADATTPTRETGAYREERSDLARVFIVDDDPSIRKAMGRMLGSAGYAVEVFDSVHEFLQREPYNDGLSCLVVDLHMPGQTGLELQATLNARNYTMPIIFITGGGKTADGVRAMKQGAMDFLSKPVDDEELQSLIVRAIEVDGQARSRHAHYVDATEKIARLTARETEVMSLVVKGMLNKQIADALGISEKTVKVHRGHIMQKMETRSVTDLVRLAEITADSP